MPGLYAWCCCKHHPYLPWSGAFWDPMYRGPLGMTATFSVCAGQGGSSSHSQRYPSAPCTMCRPAPLFRITQLVAHQPLTLALCQVALCQGREREGARIVLAPMGKHRMQSQWRSSRAQARAAISPHYELSPGAIHPGAIQQGERKHRLSATIICMSAVLFNRETKHRRSAAIICMSTAALYFHTPLPVSRGTVVSVMSCQQGVCHYNLYVNGGAVFVPPLGCFTTAC